MYYFYYWLHFKTCRECIYCKWETCDLHTLVQRFCISLFIETNHLTLIWTQHIYWSRIICFNWFGLLFLHLSLNSICAQFKMIDDYSANIVNQMSCLIHSCEYVCLLQFYETRSCALIIWNSAAAVTAGDTVAIK